MPADSHSNDTPPPVDAHATGGMSWVMVAWLIAFLAVVVFGIVSYLFGWWYQRTHNQAALAPNYSVTSQTRIVSAPPAAAVNPSGANATAPMSRIFQSNVCRNRPSGLHSLTSPSAPPVRSV
jgi:hypothetical protein